MTGTRLKILIKALKLRYGMKDLRVEPQAGGQVKFVGEINPVFEKFAQSIPIVDKTNDAGDGDKLKSVFRAMSLLELVRMNKGQGINIQKGKRGQGKGEPGVSDQRVYAIGYVEDKQKAQKDASKYEYAVMVEIEFAEGALSKAMHGPHGAMDGGTANKLAEDKKGVIEDRKNAGMFFVFHEKPDNLPKEILIFESGRRNKLVYKLERSHGSVTGYAANYLIASKFPEQEGDIAHLLNGEIRKISVVGGVQGQVSAETVATAIGGGK